MRRQYFTNLTNSKNNDSYVLKFNQEESRVFYHDGNFNQEEINIQAKEI